MPNGTTYICLYTSAVQIPADFTIKEFIVVYNQFIDESMSLFAEECQSGMTAGLTAKVDELDSKLTAWFMSVCVYKHDVWLDCQVNVWTVR